MAECEICGKYLRTGRKYCYEHKNSANSEYNKKEDLIKQSEKGYKRYKLGWFWLSIHRYWHAFVIFFGMIMFLFASYQKHFYSTIFLIIMLSFIILKIIVYFKLLNIQKKIDNRDYEYIEWVKGWAKLDREERDFKKYLLE